MPVVLDAHDHARSPTALCSTGVSTGNGVSPASAAAAPAAVPGARSVSQLPHGSSSCSPK